MATLWLGEVERQPWGAQSVVVRRGCTAGGAASFNSSACCCPCRADVHGCHDEMSALLAAVGHAPQQDTVVFVGDLVGKGPKSHEVGGCCCC